MKDDEIKHMFKEIDYKGENVINYTEFLAATLDIMTI
jgi:Ca2+-binding EF-hand superfamily protein